MPTVHPIVTKKKIRFEIQNISPSSLGLVPTMGALHKGHLSLIDQSTIENELTVVSLFVNPTQFNNDEDLKHYPNTMDQDLIKLMAYGKKLLVFTPTTNEIYGSGITAKKFDLMGLDQSMEGKSRPNHFQGVATVIQILMDIIQPNKMYLGEKDFQQLQIIRLIKQQLQWNTKIIACPTIRESNGLAMSSRNIKLSQDLRIQSQSIYRSLLYAKKAIETCPIHLIKREVTKTINQLPNLKLDYFEIVEPKTLTPISKAQKGQSYRGCIAVYARHIRLIDNIEIHY
ncbi:MAG: pantoate--beta-alanine ligase [Flavobacteriaceae bacterium]|nr:pantoate--beta-alanine ligase [Flavobacteriaceae bacterium]